MIKDVKVLYAVSDKKNENKRLLDEMKVGEKCYIEYINGYVITLERMKNGTFRRIIGITRDSVKYESLTTEQVLKDLV